MIINASDVPSIRTWIVGVGLCGDDWKRVDRLTDHLEANVQHLNVETALTSEFFASGHVSSASYARIFLPQLLPTTVHSAVYLDCDVIVEDDIHTLDMRCGNDALVSAVRNPFFDGWSQLEMVPSMGYFNAGVLVMDLSRMREESFVDMCIRAAVRGNLAKAHDQDVLNSVVAGRWNRLPDKWNVYHGFYSRKPAELGLDREQLEKLLTYPSILHFSSSVKPWSYHCTHPRRDRYFHYRAAAGIPVEPIRPTNMKQVGKRWVKRLLGRP